MSDFEFSKLDLDGAFLIRSFSVGDNRGGFSKTFEKEIFHSHGIDFSVDETFMSLSMENVLRGLHFQLNSPQSKLVTVVSGSAWDVMVDLRPKSPTFKQWRAHVLSQDNKMGFLIPAGFAHGFVSLEDNTTMLYQCDGKYDKISDTGIRYDDININVKWPIDLNKAILSQRDLGLMSFEEYIKNPMRTWMD
jgi:dTDP-4-dehydrorhamnose 3,5-epimerase